MTILFFTRLFHPHRGGVEKHVLEVSLRLRKKGHKVIIITEQHDTKLKETELYMGLMIYRIPYTASWRKKFTIWKWLFKKYFLFRQADIIHCHDVFYWFMPFKILFPQKPVFITFHGYESYPVSQKAKLIRSVSEHLAMGNICVGKFIAKWYGTKPTYIIYGGVSTVKREIKYKEPYSSVFVGRIEEQTGIMTYAKTILALRSSIAHFHFWVYGEGSKSDTIKTIADTISSTDDSQEVLQKGHFAFVSGYLTMLEAMIAKRLVFAVFDNPLKKDYLYMTPFAAYIIIVESAEELAEKVLYFLKHPKQEEIYVNKAFQFAQTQTWDTVVSNYEKLWNQ